jgi:hypothetical protein
MGIETGEFSPFPVQLNAGNHSLFRNGFCEERSEYQQREWTIRYEADITDPFGILDTYTTFVCANNTDEEDCCIAKRNITTPPPLPVSYTNIITLPLSIAQTKAIFADPTLAEFSVPSEYVQLFEMAVMLRNASLQESPASCTVLLGSNTKQPRCTGLNATACSGSYVQLLGRIVSFCELDNTVCVRQSDVFEVC